jgi:hypothetical protein
MWGCYLPAEDRPAVACIGNIQPSCMHQQRDGCGTWPEALPCRPTQPALLLRPFYILTPKVGTLPSEPAGAAFHSKDFRSHKELLRHTMHQGEWYLLMNCQEQQMTDFRVMELCTCACSKAASRDRNAAWRAPAALAAPHWRSRWS